MCWLVINCGNGKKLRVLPEGTICPNCASKNMEEIINSVQQLKAEILPLLIRALDEGTISIETNDIRGYVKEAVAKLSAV
jgi:hypothetical protein